MVEIKPMKIKGNWSEGYVLDIHTIRSVFLGYDEYGHKKYDNQRSLIGELLYRLKYKFDKSVIGEILRTVIEFVYSWDIDIDAILPVPPTNVDRVYQPVIELAKSIGIKINAPFYENCIIKIKDTPELKNVFDYGERLKLLNNAYTIKKDLINRKNILLFDDLYRSGATLNTITDALYKKGNANKVYVLVLTKTRRR